jgi:hypothetical protein
VDLEAHGGELRLGFLDRDPEGSLIEAEKHLAGVDLLIVRDVDFDNAAGDVGADRYSCGLHIRIVRRDVAPGCQIPVTAGEKD